MTQTVGAGDGDGEASGVSSCQRALTQGLWGSGTLQVADLRLVEHGSERRGALDFDAIAQETARKRGAGIMGEQACQWALSGRRLLRAGLSASWLTGALAVLSCP